MNFKKYKISEISKSMFYGSMPKDDDIVEDGKYPIFSGYRFVGYSNKKNIDEPALIVVARGVGGTGDVKIAPANSFLTNLSIAIDIDETVADKKFLYYFLNVQGLRYLDTGAAQSQITINNLKRHSMLLPDLSIQKRIADILSTYDDLIENNNRRIALLEKAAQELYKEWFVRFRFPGYENAKFENGLPEGWKIKKVKDIVKRFPFGKLYKEADVIGEGKIIVIDQSKEPYIGFHNDEPSHTANIDIPIIIFGDHSCKFQLMITPFSLSENVVPFVASNGIDTTYLYYLVKDLIETTEYKRHWTELVSKKVLLADYDIQKQFSEAIKSNLLLIESLKVQNRNLIKQRDLLLPRLMSGKLEV